MKTQALVDHLSENPINDEYEPLNTYFLDEEINSIEEENPNDNHVRKLYFDGVVNKNGVGLGRFLSHQTNVIILPQNDFDSFLPTAQQNMKLSPWV